MTEGKIEELSKTVDDIMAYQSEKLIDLANTVVGVWFMAYTDGIKNCKVLNDIKPGDADDYALVRHPLGPPEALALVARHPDWNKPCYIQKRYLNADGEVDPENVCHIAPWDRIVVESNIDIDEINVMIKPRHVIFETLFDQLKYGIEDHIARFECVRMIVPGYVRTLITKPQIWIKRVAFMIRFILWNYCAPERIDREE